MVVAHRLADHRGGHWIGDGTLGPSCFRHKACLVKQLVALQDEFLVPRYLIEIHLDALAPFAPDGGVARLVDPAPERRQDRVRHKLRRTGAPVLPGEVAIEALPARLGLAPP